MYVVCLDAGHGTGSVNGSPDGTYKEEEFTFDITARQKVILERHGVKVVLTRPTRASVPLTERVTAANTIGADIFVSNHSNAAGNFGWYNASGFLIYTSMPGLSAERNILANKIIQRVGAAGVVLRNNKQPAYMGYYVLCHTDMPAVLIEHGFHTSTGDVALLKSNAYRDLLAEATCKGILDYLGLTWRANYGKVVQERFGFSEKTMAHLKAYEFADDLLERLATKP